MDIDDAPVDLVVQRDRYCAARGLLPTRKIGSGFDGFVWKTDVDSVLKVHLFSREFQQELAVYERLQARQLSRLRGFSIPRLLHYDRDLLVLELTLVSAPFVLDFAAAALDAPPIGTDWDTPVWRAEKRRMFGKHWPDIQLLLDALRQYGIFFCDVHPGNIRPA